MQKIITLSKRNYNVERAGKRLVYNEVSFGAEWVAYCYSAATRKYDGTCCLWHDNKLWKRLETKPGKPAPAGFIPAQEPDNITGARPGWIPIGDGPEDKWHREALAAAGGSIEDGTYELCGPKVQGNPERFASHVLVPHGAEILEDCPVTFDDLRWYLSTHDIEGVVWHHPDGRMVKIKGRDFGLVRGSPPPFDTTPA